MGRKVLFYRFVASSKKTALGDIMNSMVTLGNDTVLHIWKLSREYILKVLIPQINFFVTKCGDRC